MIIRENIMKKIIIATLLLTFTHSGHAQNSESWKCAVDLQQGDRGSMTLNRTDTQVTGSIDFSRGGSDFSQEVEGRWLDREIELKRFVNSSSNQSMHGIAIRIGSEQIKMGGRYAEGLNGVWSADCDLVSSSNSKTSEQTSATEPSISMRATPFRPTSRDKVEFAAQAFHPDGIESITFFVDGKSIHRCESEECSTKYGPLKVGDHQWHVIAKTKKGTENAQRSNELVVSKAEPKGKCSVTGIATGPAAAQSSDVLIRLSGETNGKGADKTARFDAGVYAFDSLPMGNYMIKIEVPDNLSVLVTPASQSIRCDASKTTQLNFTFQ